MLRALAVTLAVLGLALSAALAGRLGWVSGASSVEAVVFAFGCILLECWKGLLPFVVAASWSKGHRLLPAGLGAVMLGLMALSFLGAMGFAEANRGSVAGKGSEAVRQAAALKVDMARARERINARERVRSEIEITAALAEVLQQPVRLGSDLRSLQVATKDCARLFRGIEEDCGKVAALRTELAAAKERARLETELAEKEAALRGFSGLETSGVGDAQVGGLAQLFGLDSALVRTAVSMGFAALLEVVASFGLYFASLLTARGRS